MKQESILGKKNKFITLVPDIDTGSIFYIGNIVVVFFNKVIPETFKNNVGTPTRSTLYQSYSVIPGPAIIITCRHLRK